MTKWPSRAGAQRHTHELALVAPLRHHRRDPAVAAAQDTEKRLDVGIGAHIAVAVEVGGAAGWAARAAEAGEEGFNIRIRAGVAVTVEVRRTTAGGR